MVTISTTKGPMDPALLRREAGEIDNDNEHIEWVEYWAGDEMVHRSAHVTLKKGILMEPVGGSIE